MHLVPGQNAPLDGTLWDFSASTPPYLALFVLYVDEQHGQTVFSRRDLHHDPGIVDRPINIDLTTVPAGVSRIVCAADTGDGHASSPPSHLLASLSGPTGQEFTLSVPTQDLHPAMICFELYRRDGGWKIRAIGQGYAAGRTQLLSSYGLQSQQMPASTTSHDANPRAPMPGQPNTLELFGMIFEDTARSTAGFAATRDYAMTRLDEEMSTAVADPKTRQSQQGERARTRAQARHDELLAQARASLDKDLTYLRAELMRVDQSLPPSTSSWSSPAWRGAPPLHYDDAIRIGELSADDIDFRIPLCLKSPLRQPLWITATATDSALLSAAAIVLRLLTANPAMSTSLDIIDNAGRLRPLMTYLSDITSPTAAAHPDTYLGHITEIARALDVRTLRARTEGRQPGAAIVVLSDFDFTPDTAPPLAQLLALVRDGALSLIIVGEGSADGYTADPLVNELRTLCQIVPLDGTAIVTDPWTQQHWHFHCDALPEGGWATALLTLQELLNNSTRS